MQFVSNITNFKDTILLATKIRTKIANYYHEQQHFSTRSNTLIKDDDLNVHQNNADIALRIKQFIDLNVKYKTYRDYRYYFRFNVP